MDIINAILSNPLYSLFVGGGGILVIIVSVIAIIAQKKRSNSQNGIIVTRSKKTSITNNDLKNQEIKVSNSEDTTIRKNKG